MALFQKTVIKKHLLDANSTEVDAAYQRFSAYFHDSVRQQNIRNSKEEQFQEGFLRELFGHIFGYTLNPEPNFNLTTELKNTSNSKKVDGAIVFDGKAIAVIELKGTNTTDLNSIETQAFGYKNNQSECVYVITSNFEKLRFYIDNSIDYEEFNLFTLSREQFNLLYLCLSLTSIQQNLPKRLKDESVSQEDAITKKLYKDYSEFKRALYHNLVELNPEFDKLLLFKKTQKLLDRFLFIFFAEDRLLLPTNLIFRINLEWKNLMKMRMTVSLYERYKVYFNDLNVGAKVTLPAFGKKTGDAIEAEFEIFAYNGGLFVPDEVLDNVKIDDEVLHVYTEKMSHYDFDSDVDVNILGHIFENSLNEIDEIKSEIEGETVDKTKTRRKKDGVFYTPKYITKYIVDNTVGKLCTEKKAELKLVDEDYTNNKKIQTKTKKAHLDKLTDYRAWLLQLTICDPACGSGAFLNQALEFLIAEYRYVDELQAKLMGDSMILSDVETSILENNIYGVDLNDESVEIAKLSLWLRTAQKGRKLNSLNNNIKCGNSLIDDPEVAGDKAFSWEKEFPEVFARGGFDVVIGNPPYVQLQSMGEISQCIANMNFKSFENTGDLYCLFYELGNIILKENGFLGFITSNKWLRANYGKSLRNYLLENTQPIELIDLGSGIFESATVDSNILIFKKSKNPKNEFLGLDISKENEFTDFSFYDELKVKMEVKKDDVWIITSIFSSIIKNKIETIGISLKNWDVKINYGIKTGFNEAFIINSDTRNFLINQDSRSQEIIVPILRGRDVHRYFYTHQNLYLINVHNGDKVNPRVEIDDYPAIKIYLSKFLPQLLSRSDKGETPYHLRSCAYLSLFEEGKLIYPETTVRRGEFVYDNNNYYLDKTCFLITGKSLKYLNTILSSKLFTFYLEDKLRLVGPITIQYSKQYIENIPIYKLSEAKQQPFIDKADLMLSLNKDFQSQTQKLSIYICSQYQLEKLSGKLSTWYELDFSDFIKELNKAIKAVKGTPLSKKDEFEWMELFEENKQKALALKAEIDRTDKKIDQMVYELYGLTEEEIGIVEGN